MYGCPRSFSYNFRPKSAHCYARPPPSNLGKTSYQEDFGGIENANPAKPILADGPKRNNPHPLQVRSKLPVLSYCISDVNDWI